jgi:hypothetical protein
MNHTVNNDLSKRFINGLKEYGLTEQEVKENWWNCGFSYDLGENSKYDYLDNKRGEDTFYSWFNRTEHELPEQVQQCICGEVIKHNFWITDGTEVIIIGSDCIKKFIRRWGKVCTNCKQLHKNRKDNRCTPCRVLLGIVKKLKAQNHKN